MSREVIERFSRTRLQGEAVPADLEILFEHNEELLANICVEVNLDDGWAPWLDTSYLRPDERADPASVADIRAFVEVCGHIMFVAVHEDGDFYGYWRGIEGCPIARSPVVCLDTEGQFHLCAGRTLAEALLVAWTSEDEDFDELKQWFVSIGIPIAAQSREALYEPSAQMTQAEADEPSELHEKLYRKYLG